MQVYKCTKCDREGQIDKELLVVSSNGSKSYECINEGECNRIVKDREKLEKEKKENEIKMSKLRKLEDKQITPEEYQSLSQEDKFEVMYDLKFDELYKLPRLRDASIHYYHPVSDCVYTTRLYGSNDELFENKNFRSYSYFSSSIAKAKSIHQQRMNPIVSKDQDEPQIIKVTDEEDKLEYKSKEVEEEDKLECKSKDGEEVKEKVKDEIRSFFNSLCKDIMNLKNMLY